MQPAVGSAKAQVGTSSHTPSQPLNVPLHRFCLLQWLTALLMTPRARPKISNMCWWRRRTLLRRRRQRSCSWTSTQGSSSPATPPLTRLVNGNITPTLAADGNEQQIFSSTIYWFGFVSQQLLTPMTGCWKRSTRSHLVLLRAELKENVE